MPRRRAAPRRRAFDDDALAVAAPKGRKSGVAPFPEEMPDFKTELKNSKGKAKTFMALLNKVSRPGTGSLALRLVQLDPEAADDDSDTEDRPETTETQVGQLNPPGIADPSLSDPPWDPQVVELTTPIYCSDKQGAAAELFQLLAFGLESGGSAHLNNALHYLKATYLITKRNLARAEKQIKKQERADEKRKVMEAAAKIAAEEAAEAEAKRIKREAKLKARAEAA